MIVNSQIVQEVEQHFKVGAGFYPENLLGDNIDANFLDHLRASSLRFSLVVISLQSGIFLNAATAWRKSATIGKTLNGFFF